MLAVVIGVSWIASYGFRFELPIVLPMLGGAAWGLDVLRDLLSPSGPRPGRARSMAN